MLTLDPSTPARARLIAHLGYVSAVLLSPSGLCALSVRDACAAAAADADALGETGLGAAYRHAASLGDALHAARTAHDEAYCAARDRDETPPHGLYVHASRCALLSAAAGAMRDAALVAARHFEADPDA